MASLLAIALCGIPLLIAPGLLFYFDVTPKVSLAAILAAAALLSARGWRCGRCFAALVAAQAASLALSTALSANPALSLSGGAWRRFGLVPHLSVLLLALAAASYASSASGRVRFLFRAIALAGIPASLYAIAQYFGWDPLLPGSSYRVGEGVWAIVRPPSTLGRANYLAGYLLHVAFAGAALAVFDPPGTMFWKRAGAAAALLAAAAIVLSGTRAAILGLFAGAAVYAFWRRPRLSRRALSAALLCAASAAAFYFSPLGLALRARVRWSVEDARGGPRLDLWRDSIRMAAGRPWTGYGPETFSAVYPRFQSAETARAYPDIYQESPHNFFLDALAAQGIPGLGLMLALTAWGFRRLWLSRESHGVAAAALAAMLAASVFNHQFAVFTLPTALYFYATLALADALSWSGPAVRPAPAAVRAVAAVAALLPALFAAGLLVSDLWLARARRALDAGRIDAAAAAFVQVRRWQPPGAAADLWYSRSLLAAAARTSDMRLRLLAGEQAFDAAVRAVSTAEDAQNAWYNLAILFAARDDSPQTERSLREAIARAPNWFKPHWALARLLLRSGRNREAAEHASRAAALNAGKNPEVGQTWAEIQNSLPKN